MSIRFYPVISTEPHCGDYLVRVNGRDVPTNTARVSRFPFNRRWPGYQRSVDQSEAIQFLSLSADEPLCFEIKPQFPFDAKEVKLRPRSLGISPTVCDDGVIRFTLPRPAYFTVEAYGRNRALHLFVDPPAEYEASHEDENTVYFGAGEHDVGDIELHSNQTLFLDEGAVVYACVHAIDAENIRILGRGILDNSRNREQILFDARAEHNDSAVNNALRRHTIQFEYCKNILIDGITIRDSLVYNVRPIGCERLNIRRVKIIGCWRYNSDGIDMHNCVDVHIADCFLRTFDDSICVKGFDCYYKGDVEKAVHEAMYRGGKSYDVFKNVLIENCVIWNDWGKCLEIGAETRAEDISNVIFRNCDLIHLSGPALDCMNVDYADVHDVTFEDIRIEADETIPKSLIQQTDSHAYVNTDPNYMPLTLCAKVVFHHEYSAGGDRRGRNRDITFRDVRVYGEKSPRASFVGYDETHKTENILIENLYWNDKPVERLEGESWHVGDFTDNVRITVDAFSEMKKNTVDSKDQLKKSNCVTFENAGCAGPRVLFVGNSITRHGFRPEIGWYHDFGMAASAKEKDYVHLLASEIVKQRSDAAFCLCQVAEWERSYKNGEELLSRYEAARDFDADIIVVRLIENCPSKEFDEALFREQLRALLQYLDGKRRAKIILSTGFWRHPGDKALLAYAEEHGLPITELGDLGEDPAMKAIGLFEHKGVANHPGDEGMRAIAERLLPHILACL